MISFNNDTCRYMKYYILIYDSSHQSYIRTFIKCLQDFQKLAGSYAFSTLYSVMQSDGNSFCGEVVLGSFNMVYSHEDSI